MPGSTWYVVTKCYLLLVLLPLLSFVATTSEKPSLMPQAPMLPDLAFPQPDHWGCSLEVLVGCATREGP